jgi:hypothetical protein
VTIVVTRPADDRAVARLTNELQVLNRRPGTPTKAEVRRNTAFVTAMQNQFRVTVSVYRSASDAAFALQSNAGEVMRTEGGPRVVRSRRIGLVVYRITLDPRTHRHDAAFERLIAVGEDR